jgi:ligand-binding sensor domain-containing protein
MFDSKRDLRYIIRLLTQLTILFCAFNLAHAQYGFDVWTVDNGLPQNEIRGITQTPDGYLWIATFNGLVRFDGVHLTIFNKKTPGLPSNQFGSLLQGRGGDLWIDSISDGLIRYHNGVFRAYGRQNGLGDIINGLTGDDNGDVWVLTDGRIFHWDEASDRFTDIAPQSPGLMYRSLLWDLGGFWTRQNNTLRCFTKGRFFDYTLPKQMLKAAIWGAALDQSETLWVETADMKQARITVDDVSPVLSRI